MPTSADTLLVLNGPNLNMLGLREPELYGHDTLADVERQVRARADELGLTVDFRQSNSEGELVGLIQQARGTVAGLVVNAGAYSHTSIAILDALRLVDAPIIEVHLSNIHRREPYRRRSYVSDAAQGMICGFGAHGYVLAVDALHAILQRR